MRGCLVLCLALALSAAPAFAQPPEPQSDEDLSILAFLEAVETAISTMDRQRWIDLQSTNADREQAVEFFEAMAPQGITRVVVKERDRAPLAGTLPGTGFTLVTEVLLETGPRGRIATWTLDIRKPTGEADERQPWRIVSQDRLSSVEGLHRLSLHPEKQYAARNLIIRSVDFELQLPAGDVFVAETPEGVTALVLLGDGRLTFSPAPKEERGQVRIFSGSEELDTPFTTALVRVSPFEYRGIVGEDALELLDRVDPREFRRAQQVFDDDIAKSYTLDLSDLSRDVWSLLPQPGDFIAEVRTRRYDKLTFTRSSGEPEDVSLFQRERNRNISLYASEQKLASRGQFYDEDDLVEYDVLDYVVDAGFSPDREWLQGRVDMQLRVTSFALGAITLKLADPLTVNAVVSNEFGRLMFLRVVNQNAIVVNLPTPVPRGFVLTLHISYQGRLPRQRINDDSVAVAADQQRRNPGPDEIPMAAPEPSWLFSNRAQWYPQAQVTDYATANLRVAVPSEYTVVASGVQDLDSPSIVGAAENGQGGIARYSFTANQPVRYLSMVISKMTRADAATVALDIVPPPGVTANRNPTVRMGGGRLQAVRPPVPPLGSRNTIALTVDANRRQEGKGRDALVTIAEILRLYSSIIGDVPYDALNVAMVENDLPGGHAPGYVAVMNNPLPTSPYTWRNDPASFSSFPEFFLAHEVAHQWFGQAVGWKNYHEQWLSEGFAQYMAALYARQRRGESAFRDIIKQFRRWSLGESSEGPIYLGYRLGHIKSEGRVFRALVYNKGAAVLHMLRLFVGDEAFFRGVRRYYRENRFKKAGTEDLQKAMEAESGLDLSRFFERWVFDSSIPRLRYSVATAPGEVVVRVEQSEEQVFDVPLTLEIRYSDGNTDEQVIRITEAVSETRIPVKKAVRDVNLNDDNAALVNLDRLR